MKGGPYCPQGTQVLIAGGGPVGLTLAKVLADFGVKAIVAEINLTTSRLPKMGITNGRSMELFRKFGVAEALRAAAVPESHPFDISWITSLSGVELHRFCYPSPEEARRLIGEKNDGTQSREPAMRAFSQTLIPLALRAALGSSPEIDLCFGWALEDFEQDEDGVIVLLRSLEDDSIRAVKCEYLVGCDGGSSRVRDLLEIGLEGELKVASYQMVHFRSDARDILQRWGVAWRYQSPFGTLIAQNDRDIWTVLAPQDPAASDQFDPDSVLKRFAGTSFEREILVASTWTPPLFVANSYRRGRVFLAGDAAHQYIPTGGYGLNTGIGDAIDLGWKLAAVLRGFGGSGLLASYERERRPVGSKNRAASICHTKAKLAVAESYKGDLSGKRMSASRRREISKRIAMAGNADNESFGIEFGDVHLQSPIVAAEIGADTPSDPMSYVPTTMPGARLPSTFLSDGQALFDRLGCWFTLIDFGCSDISSFAAAADRAGVPLKVLKLDEPNLVSVYGRDLLLVRPDHYIAWRGSANSQADANAVFRRALGKDILQ